MPLSDEERLERVYAKAASIKLAQRVRVLGLAVAVLVLASGVVLAGGDSTGGRSQVEAAGTSDDGGPGTTWSTTETTHDTSGTTTTTSTSTTEAPGGIPVRTTTVPTVPSTTTTTEPPVYTENCGGYFPGDTKPPKAPPGMEVTVEPSKSTVRRGEEVVLTLRARWTGAEPYTHTRNGGNFLFVHLNGEVLYSTHYDHAAPPTGSGEETFQPGESKTYRTRWDTSQACGDWDGLRDVRLPTGRYTVEGQWASSSTWHADPATFEITE